MVFIIKAPVYYKHIIDSILNFFYLYRPLCASLCLSWPSMANADRGSPDSSRVFRSTHDSHKGMTPPPPPPAKQAPEISRVRSVPLSCCQNRCHVARFVHAFVVCSLLLRLTCAWIILDSQCSDPPCSVPTILPCLCASMWLIFGMQESYLFHGSHEH